MIFVPESDAGDRKRDYEAISVTSDWEELPVSKKSRLELLEIYYSEVANKSAQRQKKGKEALFKDFTGRDYERLQRTIHKEFNNNIGTGAYELLSPEESKKIRQRAPEKNHEIKICFDQKAH